MMIRSSIHAGARPGGRPAPVPAAQSRRPARPRSGLGRVTGRRCAAVLAAVLAAGCSAGPAAGHGSSREPAPPPTSAGAVPAGSLVRVPVPDYASPQSVAGAFYVAWASLDSVHDQPGTYLARCAPLVTPALERQLSHDQPATAGWQAMRREHLVSLVTVRAVTHPAGVAYLRVYATRVTTTATARQVSADGITVEVTRSGQRWLVSAVLFY